MADIASGRLLEDILRQLGPTRKMMKLSYHLDKYILKSEYMLS